VLGLLSCVGGCQSILGIEELSEAPRPDAAGRGGAQGDGMSGGSAGTPSNAGADGNGGNGAGSSAGGNSGAGGSSMPGALPDAGVPASDAGGPITVQGRVVDFFRRPAPGLRIMIDQQEVLSGDEGEFTISGVVPPYDVSLIASTTQSDFSSRSYAYVYRDLTRADPTLQVYYGLPERSSTVDLTVTGASFTEDDNRRLIFAFSSPDGYYAAPGINFEAPSLYPSWSGPAATAGTAHGLLVLLSSSDPDDPPDTGAPPLVYEAYQTTPLALSDEVTSSLGLDMSADTIPQVNLTGSVNLGQFSSQTHLISTRFADGTVLPLLTAESNQGPFSYLVPALPSASLVVAASASAPGYVVAHADGVPAAADQNVALELPRPVAPTAPANGTQVGPGTVFAWSTLGQTAQVFVWHFESEGFFEGIYVITSRSEIEYPTVPGFTMDLPSDDEFAFYWSVETHGDYPSVDAAAGPDGLYDSFALEKNIGTGPSRGSRGYYTNSDIRTVDLTAQ
jgi:hypothetical protein